MAIVASPGAAGSEVSVMSLVQKRLSMNSNTAPLKATLASSFDHDRVHTWQCAGVIVVGMLVVSALALAARCGSELHSTATANGAEKEQQSAECASAAPDDRTSRPVELITNPLLLSAFHALVHKPYRCSLALVALIAASAALASPYSNLKNKPVELDPFGTRLREVQLKIRHNFDMGDKDVVSNTVLIWHSGGEDLRGSPALNEAVEKVRARLLELTPHVGDLIMATGGDAAMIAVTQKGTPAFGQRIECISRAREALRSLDGRFGGLRVAMASANAVVDASFEQCDQEINSHLLVSAPLTLGVLIVFGVRTLPRALTPFICLGASIESVQAGMVVLKWCWDELNISGPDTPCVFILLALCLDYAVFFWTRFSEERQKHLQAHTYLSDIQITLRTSGYVIILSMVVLTITFISDCLYPNQNNIGYLGASLQLVIGAPFAALYSLSVPAVLAALLPSLYEEGHRQQRCCTSSNVGICRWIADSITRAPWIFVVPLLVCVGFVPLIATLSTIEIDYDSFKLYASHSVPEFTAHQIYAEQFVDSRSTPAPVLLEAIPNWTGLPSTGGELANITLRPEFGKLACRFAELVIHETLHEAYQINASDIRSLWWNPLTGTCAQSALVGPLTKPLLSFDGHRQLLTIGKDVEDYSTAAQAMARRFWSTIEPQARWAFEAGGRQYTFRATLDTSVAEEMLMEDKYRQYQPWLLLATMIAVCIIVGYCFSSAFVAGKIVFTVVLPILAEYGLLVGIYQYGWFERLGWERTGGIYWTVRYTTAGFLFALAMDYDLFLFARVYERRLEGYDNRSAVRLAFVETGPIITLAGTLMVIPFAFIFLSSLPMIAQMGCLYFFGVAVDTYIVRVLIAPAALCIYEPMNYWPGKVPPATKTDEQHVHAG